METDRSGVTMQLPGVRAAGCRIDTDGDGSCCDPGMMRSITVTQLQPGMIYRTGWRCGGKAANGQATADAVGTLRWRAAAGNQALIFADSSAAS